MDEHGFQHSQQAALPNERDVRFVIFNDACMVAAAAYQKNVKAASNKFSLSMLIRRSCEMCSKK